MTKRAYQLVPCWLPLRFFCGHWNNGGRSYWRLGEVALYRQLCRIISTLSVCFAPLLLLPLMVLQVLHLRTCGLLRILLLLLRIRARGCARLGAARECGIPSGTP
jgi:hypothetical protein